MLSDPFRSSAWHLAATLTERLAALRTLPREAVPSNADRARTRLQRWLMQPPFRGSDYFAQRLATGALSESDLVHLLGETSDTVAARAGTPAWLTELAAAYAGLDTWQPADLPESWHTTDNMGFLDLVAPLLARGRLRVREGVRVLVEKYPVTPFDVDTVEELLLNNLPGLLKRMLSRTLVLELNVARMAGLLTGDSPEERFASFVQRLRRAETALPLLREYPVLARQIVLAIERWVACSLEFLEHLCADWEALRTLLLDAAPGALVAIDGNAGDTHRGGRAVLIATFESGAKVAYKPKPLSVDLHFQHLLAWLNARGTHPGFRTVAVLDRSEYGWVEFVAAGPCATPEEVARFYQRQGGYLALLYVLEATDFHSENLLAAGEHPVLIDLEALFHPRTEGVDLARDDVAATALDYSVLRVSMLPRLIWSSDASAGVDVSGLGATGGQLTPHPVAQMEATGTDAMHLVRRRVPMLADQNQPALGDATPDLADYTDDILTGFDAIYRLLLEHRDELLAADGPLAPFAADVVRVIIRETNTYSVLLYESFHPDLMRDALDRDRLLDRLWMGIADNPYLARVIAHEQADLLQGDIPLFTTRPNSRDLWTSNGDHLPDVLPGSSWEQVQRRIRELGPDDLARQRWIIRASLTTAAQRGAMPSYTVTEPTTPATRDQLRAAATRVGDRLAALALHGGSGVSWLGLDVVGDDRWTLAPLGVDLYNGLPGVAFFLAHLGHVTGEQRFTLLAEKATATLLQRLDSKPTLGVGGFDGWGGVLYTLAHLARLWDRADLLALANKIVAHLPEAIARDDTLDVISGSAGCIGGLLALQRVAPSLETLAVARLCGDHIVARAQAMPQGIAWLPQVPASAPLTGFSHGAAGMSWALLELAAVTDESRYAVAAQDALAYERSVFAPAAHNWPDYRLADGATEARRDDYFVAWCHGAPGIGLARLQALRHLHDATLHTEIAAAVTATLASGFGANHSLCHGDLGNLELLAAVAAQGDAQCQRATERLSAVVLESIARDGYLCAAPRALESPGLMTGLSGIGLGLLRLAEPAHVPAVLVFAGP